MISNLFKVLVAGILLSACSTSPFGRKQLHLIPENQMDSLGQATFSELKSKEKISGDKKTSADVICVVNRLLENLPGANPSEWETQVFKIDEPNAFALPGKRIGVHTGILKYASNQDQLAAVLGHEIGHVIAEHGNERMSQALAVQGLVSLTDALLELNGPKRNLILGALGAGAQVGVLLPYSRLHESEADLFGQQLMAEAGFDPKAAVEVWKNMQKMGSGRDFEFLSTHPSHETRIEKLRASLATTEPIYENTLKTKGRAKCY